MYKLRLTLAVAALLGGAATAALRAEGALARLSVVSMRSEPRHSAEQVSQALMGTPMEVLEHGRDWSRVRTPDGYEGWIINHSLAFRSDEEMDRWRRSDRVMVTRPYEMHDPDHRTDLVHGCMLEVAGDSLRLPDGRLITCNWEGWMPFREPETLHSLYLAEFADLYAGVPYQWGGMSSKGMDCSGLVRMAYASEWRLLPRDAWQQAREGIEVSPDSLKRGDLIFFGNPKTKKITHVAIYAGRNRYVHASQMVRTNSLDPASPLYLPLHIITCRRVPGVPFWYHPAYRNQ